MIHYFNLMLSRMVLFCGVPLAGEEITAMRERVTCPDCLVMLALDESLVET